MTTYMPRSAWTTTAPGGDNLPASAVDEINVHYPASGNVKLNGLSAEDVARRLRGWRQYHIDGRGWSDIGYNMAIDGAGRIWTLRGLDRVGAHAASASNPNQNRHSIGVLFVIGNNEPPTEAALSAFRQLRADVLRRSPKATRVRGHGRVPGASTACPGVALLAAIDGGALTLPPTTTPEDEFDMDHATFKRLVQEAVHSCEIGRSGITMGVALGKIITLETRVAELEQQLADTPRAVMAYTNPAFGEQDVYGRIREIQENTR